MNPARQWAVAGELGGLSRKTVENLDLREMLEVSADRRERIELKYGEHGILGQVEARGERREPARSPRQNSWFSPAKTSLTEASVKMRLIESVRSSAQGS